MKQLIRHQNSEAHKKAIIDFVTALKIDEKSEYECVIKPYRKSKSLAQLGYYWSIVIRVAMDWQGLTSEQADMFLKSKCTSPIYKEIMGEIFEIRKSIAKMKVDEMSWYIDACINFLGSHGQYVPPPQYKY